MKARVEFLGLGFGDAERYTLPPKQEAEDKELRQMLSDELRALSSIRANERFVKEALSATELVQLETQIEDLNNRLHPPEE